MSGRGDERNAVTGAGTFGDPEPVGSGVILDGVSHSVVDRNSVAGGRRPAISVGAAPTEPLESEPLDGCSRRTSGLIAGAVYAVAR